MDEYPDPIPALKQQVRDALVEALDGWEQCNAACLIGSHQARVSNLKQNRLEHFSLETLVRFLTRIDHRVELVLHRPTRGLFAVSPRRW
jgi:predicted XRE-type DNA-binding protein